MKKSYIILIVILSIFAFVFLREQPPYLEQNLSLLNKNDDGKIVSYEKVDVLTWHKRLGKNKEINNYNEIEKKIKNTNTYVVTYLSNDEKAEAFIMKPREVDDNYPVLFFNRSGLIKRRKDKRAAYWFTSFFSENYIIVVPKYKGEYRGEQLENFAAADTQQYLDLFTLIKSLPYVDENQMAAIGVQKGGQLVYQAIKNDVGLKAASVINTPTDIVLSYENSIYSRKKIFEDKLGGSPGEVKEKYVSKSPYYWPEKIDIPLLVIHHKGSKSVKTEQAEKLISKFEEIKYDNYKSIISSDLEWEFVLEKSIEWIKSKTDIPLEM